MAGGEGIRRCALSAFILTACLLTFVTWMPTPALAAGPREYVGYIGDGYAFTGSLDQVEQVTSGTVRSLRLAPDTADNSGNGFVASGSYDTGALDFGIAAKKWITGVNIAGSVTPSTSIDVWYSADGKPFANLGSVVSSLSARPLVVNTIRFRFDFASGSPTETPVLNGMAVAFYLQEPKRWTPPKKSGSENTTKTAGSGSGGGGGTGSGSGSGSGGSGATRHSTTGSGGSGSGSGISSKPSASKTSTGTGASTGGGLPSQAGSGLLIGDSGGGERVEGMKLQESVDETPTSKPAEKPGGSDVPSPIQLLAVYCGGLSWALLRSVGLPLAATASNG